MSQVLEKVVMLPYKRCNFYIPNSRYKLIECLERLILPEDRAMLRDKTKDQLLGMYIGIRERRGI